MKTTKIEITCGIYNAEITIRDYGHKICVTEPYVRWKNNTGNLAEEKWATTDPAKMELIRAFAAAGALALDNGATWDMLDLI